MIDLSCIILIINLDWVREHTCKIISPKVSKIIFKPVTNINSHSLYSSSEIVSPEISEIVRKPVSYILLLNTKHETSVFNSTKFTFTHHPIYFKNVCKVLAITMQRPIVVAIDFVKIFLKSLNKKKKSPCYMYL